MRQRTIIIILLVSILVFFATTIFLLNYSNSQSSLFLAEGIHVFEPNLMKSLIPFSSKDTANIGQDKFQKDYHLYKTTSPKSGKTYLRQHNIAKNKANYSQYVDSKLLWGTYKSHLFHCITQATPQKLNFGLAYHSGTKLYHSYNDIQQARKFTEYKYHDAEEYTQSVLQDESNHLFIENYFLKESATPEYQKWHSVTVNREDLSGSGFLGLSDPSPVSLIYYFTIEDMTKGQGNIQDTRYLYFDSETLTVRVKDTESDDEYSEFFKIVVYPDQTKESSPWSSALQVYTYVSSLAKQNTWEIDTELSRQFILNSDLKMKVLPNNHESQSPQTTLIALQFIVHPKNPFTVHVMYSNNKQENTIAIENNYGFVQGITQLSESIFIPKYNKRFPSQVTNPKHKKCEMSSVSHLLSGISYYYGPIPIQNDYTQPSLPLFTATPSKTQFPRGFLWDEGFHGLVYCNWNPELCLKALGTWMDTEFSNGWIPREQTRGLEAMSYANFNFVAQIRDEANPPTMVFHVLRLIQYKEEGMLTSESEEKLKEIYPKLAQWLQWFRNTQRVNDIDKELFHWKSQRQNQGLVLGSGLDDYPRGIQPNKYNPLAHLDLQVWLMFFSENLMKIAEFFEKNEELEELKEFNKELRKGLEEFLDPEDHIYKDLVYDIKTKEKKYSPHFGYVNLFPLFFGYIERDSSQLSALLNGIRDNKKLWTPYGLRSLAYDDPLYMKTRDKYWGGPIWININYLTLRGLKLYYYENAHAKQIYEELRENIIETVCNSKEDTGYFYEQFNQDNGKGQKNYPFAGWTALIGLIIDEKY